MRWPYHQRLLDRIATRQYEMNSGSARCHQFWPVLTRTIHRSITYFGDRIRLASVKWVRHRCRDGMPLLLICWRQFRMRILYFTVRLYLSSRLLAVTVDVVPIFHSSFDDGNDADTYQFYLFSPRDYYFRRDWHLYSSISRWFVLYSTERTLLVYFGFVMTVYYERFAGYAHSIN